MRIWHKLIVKIIFLLLCSLATAATPNPASDNISEGWELIDTPPSSTIERPTLSNTMSRPMAAWEPIDTAPLSTYNKVCAAIINLAQAHFIHQQPNLTEAICKRMDTLFRDHALKLQLHNILDSKSIGDQTDRAQRLIKLITTPTYPASPLQEDLNRLLSTTAMHQNPAFHGNLEELLQTPDTKPITDLLEEFIEAATHRPLITAPLETLLHLNWDEVFSTFVENSPPPAYCLQDIHELTSLINASSLEEFLKSAKFAKNSDLDAMLAFKYRALDTL